MIRASDKLSAVLARDERLVDVLSAAAPPFEALRNPEMRRNMGLRVTVEQAAQIAGLDATALVDRLNRALVGDNTSEPAAHANAPALPVAVPTALLATSPERLVDVDVRDDLRSGREPFGRIMAAAKTLEPRNVLRIRATFEPAPLYGVLAKHGLSHFTEQLAPDDWRVWFFRDEGARAAERVPVTNDLEDMIVLDVRDLEPPEPMIRTLEALETLPRGKTLVQINVRVPRFLLPKLDERGFVYEIREQSADLVRLFIRHKPIDA